MYQPERLERWTMPRAMWAVRTKQKILGTFDEREEAEEFAREWRSFHGDRCWIVRTER